MRKWLAATGLILIFACIAALFWLNEWRYSLPTPVPRNYHAVSKGAYINLEGKFTTSMDGPVFLHFFNPDCPCSRFNIGQFKALVKKYGNQINFAIVVMTKDESYSSVWVQEKFDLDVPVLSDTMLAAACGVYSTPQAVLLDAHHFLYYRGNYNRSRYCTDSKTSYARIAIEAMMADVSQPVFDQYALRAYGCSLPACKK